MAKVTEGLPYSEYEKLEGIRASDLKLILKSPREYYNAMFRGKKKASAAMHIGSAAHVAILEPDRFVDEVVIFGATRRGKEWDAFREVNQGKIILNETEASTVEAMVKAVHSNPSALRLLEEGKAEITFEFELHGLPFKSRLDWLTTTHGDTPMIVDLKTTRHLPKKEFMRDVFDLGYHIQFALYHAAVKQHTGKDPAFYVLAVENSGDEFSESAVYEIGTDIIEAGYADVKKAVGTLKECRATNVWPSPNDGIQRLTAVVNDDWLLKVPGRRL